MLIHFNVSFIKPIMYWFHMNRGGEDAYWIILNFCWRYILNHSGFCWRYILNHLNFCWRYILEYSSFCWRYILNQSSFCWRYILKYSIFAGGTFWIIVVYADTSFPTNVYISATLCQFRARAEISWCHSWKCQLHTGKK